MSGVEEIESERDGSLHSGMSAYLSESDVFSSHLVSTGFRRISKPAVSPIEERSPFEYNNPIEEGNSSVSS